jgi:hypothetical protein
MSIKIITGHSDPGGSTIAHINLTNLLNENGYDCTLYGKQTWHLDKCKSGLMHEVNLHPDDILVVHFLPISQRPNCKKFILSLHEKHLFPLQRMNYKIFDKIHYIRESQRLWHGVDHPYFDCMYVQNRLDANPKTCKEPTAGIIGSIDPNKQVHLSIKRALDAGFKKIKMFGKIVFNDYYMQSVYPYVEKYPDIVEPPTYAEDKQAMYDQITDVFHTSKLEVCPYIQGESILTGTNFHGNDQTDEEYKVMSDQEILDIWVKELELDKV